MFKCELESFNVVISKRVFIGVSELNFAANECFHGLNNRCMLITKH